MSHSTSRAVGRRAAVVGALLASALVIPGAASATVDDSSGADAASSEEVLSGWLWPVRPARIAAPYVAPAHAYGSGHRGIDLDAAVGDPVAAPAAGSVAFAGSVAGRGIVTIDHGGGLVTTLEPVLAAVAVGARVTRGDSVGTVDGGGHATPGTLHFGVRRDGEYINPMLLLGGVPRAILLPCC